VLADVYPNSPAAKAGLRINDVILSVGGKPMENARQFDVNLYGRKPGSTVNLEVGRALQRVNVQVPLVERSDPSDLFREMVTPEKNLVSRLGLLALDLTPELARMIPGVRAEQGVVVAGVTSDSRGEAGPAPGDVIYGVNGERVTSLANLRSAIQPLGADSTVVLHVGRQGQLRFLAVTLE
jgi:S1-C subfamily serine protease